MRVTFWHSDKPRECILADAFADGVRLAGDSCELRRLLPEPEVAACDVAVMVGVKSRRLYRAHWDQGIHVVYVDKGYSRHAAAGHVKIWEYWRVAIDAHHPTADLMARPCPADRWDALGLEWKPWRKAGGFVLLAGSSAKYHEFYGLKDPTAWARKVSAEVRALTAMPVVYRPKPSWHDAVAITGTTFSGSEQTIEQALAGAWCVLTHGSNAVFEAQLLGVPTVVLGEAVSQPLSSRSIPDILQPHLAPEELRRQWFQNLAYYQWTLPEMSAGNCWRWIRPLIYGRPRQ